MESVAKVETRDQKMDFAKDICTKVISEPKRQVEEFKKCVALNLEEVLDKNGRSNDRWIVSTALEALDKAADAPFSLKEAVAACNGIEVEATWPRQEPAVFLQEAVAKATEEMELDRDEQTHDDDTGLH